MTKILFISKNISVPGKPSNNVIMKIAELHGEHGDNVDIIFPKEWVPLGFNFLPKYRHLSGLKPWKHKNLLITPYTYPRLPHNRYPFWLLPYVKTNLKKFISNYEGIEVVHGHYILPDGWIANQIARYLNIPSVITIRSSDIKLLKKAGKPSHSWQLAEITLREATVLHCLNGPAQKFIKENFNIESIIVPHGIPKDLLGKKILREKDIDLLVVAESIERKRINWVINSFKSFKKLKKDQSRKLVVVGGGPKLNELKSIAGNASGIQFTGKIPHHQVIKLMKRSRVFALPSVQETFGLAYLEAAANANAIIGLKGEGIDGVFTEKDGALFPQNYAEFNKMVEHLIVEKDVSRKLGMAAYRKAQTLGWKKIISDYRKLYYSANYNKPQ